MSSILASNGVVLATAMAAGTAILLAFCLQKQPTGASAGTGRFSVVHHPRPCISSDVKKIGKKKKNKKVHFAEDVMEPSGNGEEFRRRLKSKNIHRNGNYLAIFKEEGGKKKLLTNYEGLPANRMALYSGILRDRGVHRVAYSC